MTEQTQRTETESKLKNIVITTPDFEIVMTKNRKITTPTHGAIREAVNITPIPSHLFPRYADALINEVNGIAMARGVLGEHYSVRVAWNVAEYSTD